ncbi:MAG: hypothetical protein R3E08_10795 [Thiotrichaceae bacterium]
MFRRIEALLSPTSSDNIVQRGSLMIDSQRLTATWKGTQLGIDTH